MKCIYFSFKLNSSISLFSYNGFDVECHAPLVRMMSCGLNSIIFVLSLRTQSFPCVYPLSIDKQPSCVIGLWPYEKKRERIPFQI